MAGPGGGPIVAGTLRGRTTQPLLARYDSRGRIVRGFGHNGLARFSGVTGMIFGALALDRHGRIVAAGLDGTLVARAYVRSGRPDSHFGRAGVSVLNLIPEDLDAAYSVLIEPGGRVVTAGSAATGGDEGLDTDFSIVRRLG